MPPRLKSHPFGVLEAISKPPFGRSNLLILNGLNRVLKSALIKRRHLSGGRSEHILGGNHAYTSGLHPASGGYRKVGVCHSRMRFANSFHGREITLDVSHPWWYAPWRLGVPDSKLAPPHLLPWRRPCWSHFKHSLRSCLSAVLREVVCPVSR